MDKLVRFPLNDGGFVTVMVDERQSGPVPAANPGELAAKARITFDEALAHLRPIAKAIVEQVKDLGPREAKVELGITYSAETGIVLAKTSGEGSCKITLSWRKPKEA
jgi:hypothetical protein